MSPMNDTCQPRRMPVSLTAIFITLSVLGMLISAVGNSLIFSRHVQNKTTEDSGKLFASEHVIRELHANTSDGNLYLFSN